MNKIHLIWSMIKLKCKDFLCQLHLVMWRNQKNAVEKLFPFHKKKLKTLFSTRVNLQNILKQF